MDELTRELKSLRKEVKAQTEILKEIRTRIAEIENQIEDLKGGFPA